MAHNGGKHLYSSNRCPITGVHFSQWEPDGNIYYAGEAYDEEGWSYMNGAIASGERVAKEIHQNY